MKHYLKKEEFAELQKWANGIRGYYGAPVYLVGSVLQKKDYRDVDIRIILSDYEFGCRYGTPRQALVSTQEWIDASATGNWTKVRWKWSDDCVKRTRIAWRDTNLNIDFQVYPESFAKMYEHQPKLQIDTRP